MKHIIAFILLLCCCTQTTTLADSTATPKIIIAGERGYAVITQVILPGYDFPDMSLNDLTKLVYKTVSGIQVSTPADHINVSYQGKNGTRTGHAKAKKHESLMDFLVQAAFEFNVVITITDSAIILSDS